MKILFEDKDIIVICKEAGRPVQAGRVSVSDIVSDLKKHLAAETAGRKAGGEGSVQGNSQAGRTDGKQSGARMKEQGQNASPGGCAPYLGIVHRLDQPVEGILVFAKTPKAAASLSRQAAAKTDMEKEYTAMVHLDGTSFPTALEARKKECVLVDWILRDRSNNTSLIADENTKDAKRAELVFRTEEIRNGIAVLKIRLHTGRHHQIRVQTAHAGMPIVGDRKYGQREDPPGLCLCASRLKFRHPGTGKMMEYSVVPTFLSGH